MESKQKKIYDGNLRDSTDFVSDKFLKVNSCGTHTNTASITVRKRGRHDWSLLYVRSGNFSVEIGGKGFVLSEGNFAIYPPEAPHRYYQIGGVAYFVHFSGSEVYKLLSETGLLESSVFLNCKPSAAVISLCEKMIFEYALNSPKKDDILSIDMLSLIAELARCRMGTEELGDQRLRDVIIDMNKNFKSPIDINKYAEMIGLSKGRFIGIFKKAMNKSPYSYVLSLRLSYSAELLINSELQVSQISYEAGFDDPLYFSRLFKKAYGISPKGYRAARLNQNSTEL